MTSVVPGQIDGNYECVHVHGLARKLGGKRLVSISLEIEGGNDFNSAQAASSASGVSRREGKDCNCAPKEKNRQQEGRK